MSKVKKNVRTVKKSYPSPFSIYWEKENYYFLFGGIGLLLVGYYVMSLGNWDNGLSLNLSPVLLLIGYALVLPAAIFYRKNKARKNEVENVSGKS